MSLACWAVAVFYFSGLLQYYCRKLKNNGGTLPCKTKRQSLVTLQVSRCCLLAFQSRTNAGFFSVWMAYPVTMEHMTPPRLWTLMQTWRWFQAGAESVSPWPRITRTQPLCCSCPKSSRSFAILLFCFGTTPATEQKWFLKYIVLDKRQVLCYVSCCTNVLSCLYCNNPWQYPWHGC